METLEIIGKNYLGEVKNIRYACRALIIKDNKVLLSYETKTDTYMLPGGGMENDETARDTVIREVREETGRIIVPSDVLLEIDEYYGDFKYVSYYFTAEVTGVTSQQLTPVEVMEGLEPRWVPIDEMLKIFANYEDPTFHREEKRGLYFREYKAIKQLLSRL